jgi:hypothetical protein
MPICIIATVQVEDAIGEGRLCHDERWRKTSALFGKPERAILSKAIITVSIKTVKSDQFAALDLPRRLER